MMNLTRNFFIVLSNNKFLNAIAKKWGFHLGADKFVAGTDMISTVKKLNQSGISCILDNLGEFVYKETEALLAKDDILKMVESIQRKNLIVIFL